ncbi:MAG: CoA transferase [Alphaproteobacteria bacterium]|nr:CoA transferase [Alphaproteobacteria bacterium]
MTRPLEGTTVLDLTSGGAGAYATMFLSDCGARVLRAVRPEAPLFRDGGFVIWDRGKEAIALDPSTAEGRAALDTLVPGLDMLVEDFAPSSPLQDVVRYDRLKGLNPRLVACSITAYGLRGPLKDDPPDDDLVLARAGVQGGMPGFRPAPVHTVHPLPSVGAALFACIGCAASLLAREETGRGRKVETSMLAGALLYHPKVIGEGIERHVFQTHPSGSAPFYSVYECADGNYIQLGCVHPGFIRSAAGLMGIADKVAEPRFLEGRGGETPEDVQEMRDTLTEIMKTRTAADWAAAFEAADVPFAPSRHAQEGLEDPQVIHNKMVQRLADPDRGEVVQMGAPIHFTVTEASPQGPRAAGVSPVPSLPSVDGKPAAADALQDQPPLAGIRVLEITNLIAGPTSGRLLADLGADVIKLEPPAGDLSRPIGRTYFYNVNFNKRSVCFDASKPGAKDAIQRLAASCDAVLANLRPGATERMGIGPAINPDLIEVHLTGYGWTGPYSKRPGIDPLAQAMMGLQRAQGGPYNPPSFPAELAPTDYTTGAMGTLGLILALYQRKRHGVVQRVESNLLNGGIVLSSAWFSQYRGRPERPLADQQQYGLSAYHRLYRVADGWVYVVADAPAEQQALRAWLGVGDLDAQGDGHPAVSPLGLAMAAAFQGRKLADCLAGLKGAGVPAAESQKGDSELFLDDPHSQQNNFVAERQHPKVGKLKVAWNYIQFSDTAPTLGRHTPLLGEHTAEVLAEAGLSQAEIDALFANGGALRETA